LSDLVLKFSGVGANASAASALHCPRATIAFRHHANPDSLRLRVANAISHGLLHDPIHARSMLVAQVMVEDYVRTLHQRGLTDSYHLLTDREKEVLQLLAEGRSNKEVATLLELGLSTVETHRANLMQKLNLHILPRSFCMPCARD
jgi:DNA-binding NarL/FixJ family response regulator